MFCRAGKIPAFNTYLTPLLPCPPAPMSALMMRNGLNLILLCFTLAGAETLQGIFRNAVIAPRIGTKKAKQLTLISGTLMMFVICYFWIPTLAIEGTMPLLLVGLLLAGFMAAFDMVLGRYLIKMKWRVVLKDFDPRQGNYLLVGLLVLVFIPLMVMSLHQLLPP